MKKYISLALSFLLLITLVFDTASAKEIEQYYTDEQEKEIKNKYENNENMLKSLFCQDSALGYWKMINDIKKNKRLSLVLDGFSALIEIYPGEKDYAEILANLIIMQSGILAEQIENQSHFDNMKDGSDYMSDIIEIANSFIGAGDLFEILGTAIGTGVDGIDMIIENSEQAKYYEVILQDYSEASDFLNAISKYAECEELREVASSLLEVNDTLLMKRIEYLSDVSENAIKYETEFFINNMSMELLKETDEYLTDETVKWYVDEGIHLKNGILSLKDARDFAFKATILAGDIGFGTSNVYKRYQEMKTVADIADALVKANESISVSAQTQQEEIKNIQKKCEYYKALLVTHARGEYLIYQLLMSDAGTLSDVRWIREYFNKSQETTNAWYKSQTEILIKYYDILNNIFYVTDEKLQENDFQEWNYPETEVKNLENTADIYELYKNAVEKNISSGNWREEVTLTGDMNLVSSDKREKMKTKAALEATSSVENYDEKDLSKLKISGDGNIQAAGQNLAWTVDYADGVAHYQYTEPASYTNDVAIDPICFQFNVLTREMMQDASISGNTIRFTVSGDEMAQVASETMNMINGIENLELGDGTVKILIDEEAGTISGMNMTFHASMEYMGYQADVDYDIQYQFIPLAASADSETGTVYGQFDKSKVPEGAGEYNGHYYYAYNLDTITNWEEAKQYCEEMGGYLATVTSREEDEFLYAYLQNTFQYENAYFGFTDREEEGNWKWSNGEEGSYTNWHEGEPNAESAEEDFAMYYYKYPEGTWNDGDFGGGTVNSGTVFICEWGEF